MPNNSHPLYTAKDPNKVKLNVAALLLIVLYVLFFIILFGANLATKSKPNHMKRAGWPVDVQRKLTIKTWELA